MKNKFLSGYLAATLMLSVFSVAHWYLAEIWPALYTLSALCALCIPVLWLTFKKQLKQ
jgi:hypothetical protein